jgi:hypothetical protein
MSELLPTKSIALDYHDCTDPAREYEFNHWYNRIHIPALEATPGIESVTRYRNTTDELREGQTRYLTVYRISADDPWALMQQVAADDAKRATEGRMIDCLKVLRVTVWDFLVCRRSVSPPLRPETNLPDGMPEAIFIVPTLCNDPAREDEFCNWYLYTHFHDLLETPGVVQAHRYRTLDPNLPDGDPSYVALYEFDADDPAAVQRLILETDRDVRIPQGRMITCIRAPHGLATYQHIDV